MSDTAIEYPYTYRIGASAAKVRTEPNAKSAEFGPALRPFSTAYGMAKVPSTGTDGYEWVKLKDGGYFAAHLGERVYESHTVQPQPAPSGDMAALIAEFRAAVDAVLVVAQKIEALTK